MKKLLVVGLILLLVGVNIPSIPSKPLSAGNIITVDNEGDGDYISIKEAVNNSNSGDIIKVYSGTYLEQKINISIENITLYGVPYELGIGNDTGRPVINNTVFRAEIFGINANGVTISGFINLRELYIANKRVTPLPKAIIIGKLNVEVDIDEYWFGIDRVEFYVNNKIRSTKKTEPYNWSWTPKGLITPRQTLKVVAYDNEGNSASDEVKVWRLF